MREDVYSRVTARIIADLEQGVRPWLKPWSAANTTGRILRPLRGNGVPYQGINTLLLWGEAQERGYISPTWLTYRQGQELGGQVRRGERGSTIVYADRIQRTETDSAGEQSERVIPFLKSYVVFNVEQISGLPERLCLTPEPRLDPVQRIGRAEAFIAATGASIQHGGTLACYSLAQDCILLPPFESFRDAESYYGTALHELSHWTRHPSRLARDFGRQRFGDEGYAMEELVAELGAAFLSADLDLTPEPRQDHAAYIASWLKVLHEDKRAIFTAASHAQGAADYLTTAGLARANHGVQGVN
jgi:antirestriction protein ArdC